MRILLKKALTALTKWAVKKHDIQIIAILGEKQSRLTSYILWEMLRKKYFTRCQWDRSFWDLSIPLTILGYDARQRNMLEWVVTLFKATTVLLTQSAKSQKIILHIPYSLPEILAYWIDLINPEVVLAFENDLNADRVKIIENHISPKKTKLLIVGKDFDQKWLTKNKIAHDLPGVFWDMPVLGASYVASKYKISADDINKTLKNLEPLTFLKVREKITK